MRPRSPRVSARRSRDRGQMMIVVLGDEQHVIDHAHWLLQPRVQRRANDERVVVVLESRER